MLDINHDLHWLFIRHCAMTNYTQQDYEKDKAIIANVPNESPYLHINGRGMYFESRNNLESYHKVSDLRQKIALYEQWKYYQDLLKENGFEGITDLLAQHKKANARIAELEKQEKENDIKVMANARNLIKAKVRTSNARLWMELHGTGMSTAARACLELGLDPYGNQTSFNEMHSFLKEKELANE